MHTADEWRLAYFQRYQKPVPPASMLSDILLDMEELEASIRFLEAQLIADNVFTDNP